MAFNEVAFRADPDSFDIRVCAEETVLGMPGMAFLQWRDAFLDTKPGVFMLHKAECLIDPCGK
jgi:hypothetical protein